MAGERCKPAGYAAERGVFSGGIFSEWKQIITVEADSDYAAQLWGTAGREALVSAFPTAAKVAGFSRDGKDVMLFNPSDLALEFGRLAAC